MNAVKHIDKHDRVFGLDMLRSSLYIKGRPSLQLFSYAQALRGADLNFSFTEHCSRIVQYRTEHAANPGRKLIWEPETTRREDMVNFNKVLLNADQSLHEWSRRQLNLEQIYPGETTWRLYRIKSP